MACDVDGVDQKWQQLSKDRRRTGSREKKREKKKRKKQNTSDIRCIQMTTGASVSLSGTQRGGK